MSQLLRRTADKPPYGTTHRELMALWKLRLARQWPRMTSIAPAHHERGVKDEAKS